MPQNLSEHSFTEMLQCSFLARSEELSGAKQRAFWREAKSYT